MSKCDCTDSYICELCMPDTIDELASLRAELDALRAELEIIEKRGCYHCSDGARAALAGGKETG